MGEISREFCKPIPPTATVLHIEANSLAFHTRTCAGISLYTLKSIGLLYSNTEHRTRRHLLATASVLYIEIEAKFSAFHTRKKESFPESSASPFQ